MKDNNIEPNATTFEYLIWRYISCGNLEMSLKLLFEMERKDFSPRFEIAQDIIKLCTDNGMARLAVEIARNYEDGELRKLNPSTWVDLLAVASDMYYVNSLRYSLCDLLIINVVRRY
jgi:hypothetical protein